MHRLALANAVVLLLASTALAQPVRQRMVMPPGPMRGGFGGPGDFAFVRGEFGLAGQVVKGAPYSGQAVTQFNQTLADGNHIQRTTTAAIARDSEGRIRIERSMEAIGPLAGSGAATKTIFINDPVAAMSYVLDPDRHTARQMPSMVKRHAPGSDQGTAPGNVWKSRSQAGSAPGPRQEARANVKTDDLGTQVIDGLTVQGKRATRTIAAARAGSDRDIEVVTETWYSPDLQMVVMSKTSDPRFGESVYKLTNISRAEPDSSLFSVPADYQMQQGRPPRNDQ